MRLVTFSQLQTEKGIPYCRVHLMRLVAGQKFPKPVSLSDNNRRIAWVESEVDAWAEQRAALRETKAAA